MRPHLSVAELGFLLGRLPLETLPEAAEPDRRSLDSLVAGQAALAQPRLDWNRPPTDERVPDAHKE